MSVPFDIFVSDQQISEDYRRFDQLIGDLYDALYHVLTSGRVASPDTRFREPANPPDFRTRETSRRTRGLHLNGRLPGRNGLNNVYPDLLSNIYSQSKRAVVGNTNRTSGR